LQREHDGGNRDSVDLGEGVLEYLARKKSAERVNLTYHLAANSLCAMGPRMTDEQWLACTYTLCSAGATQLLN
jgi:hypothetical protein